MTKPASRRRMFALTACALLPLAATACSSGTKAGPGGGPASGNE